MLDITVVILTYNEEIHISRCINSVQRISKNIYVIDSFSTDNTIKIAQELGVYIFQNKWENSQSKQFQFALSVLPSTTKWVFRIDADEYIDDSFLNELFDFEKSKQYNVKGIILKSKRVFLNKQLNFGKVTFNNIRLFDINDGHITQSNMDERIFVNDSKVVIFDSGIIDHNLNGMYWWINKHNMYSTREAADYFYNKYNTIRYNFNYSDSFSRRHKNLYYQLPIFIRPFLYFIYRYFICLGFLDGKSGFLWHFFQGIWYRLLVDIKILEIKNKYGNNYEHIKIYFLNNYNIKL